MRPTHLDLFSGIGGFALAAQWAGFRTVAFSEIEPAACEVLRRQWPGIPNTGDIRKFNGRDFAGIALVTGGFPCQPFSVAGKRRGKEDDRHLWPEMLRVISEARPTWIVGENVAGIVAMELDSVLSDLEGIGYECQPLVIPAVAVDAKHRRDRVWIVAHNDGGRFKRTGIAQEAESIRDAAERSAPVVADDASQGLPQPQEVQEGREFNRRRTISGCGGDGSEYLEWQPEPDVGRVANGIPARLHRLKGLGNAIVPQVALEILREIRKLI